MMQNWSIVYPQNRWKLFPFGVVGGRRLFTSSDCSAEFVLLEPALQLSQMSQFSGVGERLVLSTVEYSHRISKRSALTALFNL